MPKIIHSLFICIVLLNACVNNSDNTGNTTQNVKKKPQIARINTTYQLLAGKDNIKKYLPRRNLPVLLALNRIDSVHITNLDTLLIPGDASGNVNQYSPFPYSAPSLKDINKIIFFSYPAQYFAAYESGDLVYAGPTNMGRQKDPTPTGLFFTNWKAETTKSTFNDEWELKWNFNVENKLGVGWHQYAMPGYPASHSCLRLMMEDAQDLYHWADEWMLQGKDSIIAKGTPVIVFGSYPFGQTKPWLQLANDPNALDISPAQLQKELQPYLHEILAEQKKRDGRLIK